MSDVTLQKVLQQNATPIGSVDSNPTDLAKALQKVLAGVALEETAFEVSNDHRARNDDVWDSTLINHDIFAQTVEKVDSIKNNGVPSWFFGFMPKASEAARGLTETVSNVAIAAIKYTPFLSEKTRKNAIAAIGHEAQKIEEVIAPSVAVSQIGNNGYLYNLGRVESRNNDLVHARTSSATGRFQFIKQSWLATVYAHGKEHGGALAVAATHIIKKGNRYDVDGASATEQAILEMRTKPEYSFPMADAYSRDNAVVLTKTLGRPVNATELYIGRHVLNAYGDGKMFLKGLQNNPDKAAASYMSAGVVNANRGIFYDRSGHAATFREIYERYYKGFGGDAVYTSGTQYASVDRPAPTGRRQTGPLPLHGQG